MSCWQKEKTRSTRSFVARGSHVTPQQTGNFARHARRHFMRRTSRTVEVTICVIPERTARSTVRFTTTWVSRSKSARLCNHCKLAFPGKGIELLPGRKRERGEHRYCEALIFAYWAFALCTMPHISEPYIRLQCFFFPTRRQHPPCLCHGTFRAPEACGASANVDDGMLI